MALQMEISVLAQGACWKATHQLQQPLPFAFLAMATLDLEAVLADGKIPAPQSPEIPFPEKR